MVTTAMIILLHLLGILPVRKEVRYLVDDFWSWARRSEFKADGTRSTQLGGTL